MSRNSTSKNNNRRIVSIDITDFYDDIKRLCDDEIRTIEEEVKYLVKSSLQNKNYSITYPSTVSPFINNPSYKTNKSENDEFEQWSFGVNTSVPSSRGMQPINEDSSISLLKTTN